MTPLTRLFRSGTTPLYVVLALLCVVMLLSILRIDPGFTPQTTPSRLYEHTLVNASAIVVIILGLTSLRLSGSAQRDFVALVFSGFIWGISAASALFFDVGLAVVLSGAAGFIYRAHVCPVGARPLP